MATSGFRAHSPWFITPEWLAALIVAVLVAAQLPFSACAQTLDGAMRSVVSVLPDWPQGDRRRLEEPEASGVVVLDGKTIVTALHVVDKAISIRIRTLDGDIFPARLTGRDRGTDLATLAFDKPLPAIAQLERVPALGEKVCAIGNAFGFGLTVTCGVISGLHRAGMGFNRIEDFVQTDAAVNPGASGGALVTEKGEFVGLLSAIFTKSSDANIGINFAVSAGLTNEVARQLAIDGQVKRPISGLRLEQVPAGGETGRLGARVATVTPGRLGEKAGLKVGDVIFRAGGRRVRKPEDFVSAMTALLAGRDLEIEIVRDGEELTLKLLK